MSALRRTLLTTASLRPATHTARLYQPLITTNTKLFSTATAKMGVHNIKNKIEWDEAMSAGGVAVVDFFATWCGPCKVIAPKIVEFSDQYTDAKFYKLDVDEVPDVAQEVGVRAMPTFMIYKDGEKIKEVVGANPVAIESAIKAASA